MSDTDGRARNYRAIRRKMEALELDLRRAAAEPDDPLEVAALHRIAEEIAGATRGLADLIEDVEG